MNSQQNIGKKEEERREKEVGWGLKRKSEFPTEVDRDVSQISKEVIGRDGRINLEITRGKRSLKLKSLQVA